MCERIGDYNVELTESFCENFNDLVVNIAGFDFPIREESISQAIGITLKGEKWFKR